MLITPYFSALAISLGINLVFFVFAALFRTDKLTDLTYGLTFIILVLGFLFFGKTFYWHQLALTVMVCLWAIRLVGYLFIRILKIKKDSRFDDIRQKPLNFLKFWLLQGLSVWIIILPSLYLLLQKKDYQFSLIMFLGIVVWFFGLVIETIADWQKFTFKNKPKNKNLWISSGLWTYSRHPNYFGEILVWWGIFIFVSPLLSGWFWVTVVGPIFITSLLLFVSGIPPLEKRYQKKYANNKAYQEYRRKTSLLIPLPSRH
jgi:steroid 5-alpha reductase family enzyme